MATVRMLCSMDGWTQSARTRELAELCDILARSYEGLYAETAASH